MKTAVAQTLVRFLLLAGLTSSLAAVGWAQASENSSKNKKVIEEDLTEEDEFKERELQSISSSARSASSWTAKWSRRSPLPSPAREPPQVSQFSSASHRPSCGNASKRWPESSCSRSVRNRLPFRV